MTLKSLIKIMEYLFSFYFKIKVVEHALIKFFLLKSLLKINSIS